MRSSAHKPDLQTTTVRLPKRMYEEARSVIENGTTEARSFNDLLIDSLSEKLSQLRRQQIDAEFVGMKADVKYHRQSAVLDEQFRSNDWETLRAAEKHK